MRASPHLTLGSPISSRGPGVLLGVGRLHPCDSVPRAVPGPPGREGTDAGAALGTATHAAGCPYIRALGPRRAPALGPAPSGGSALLAQRRAGRAVAGGVTT